MIMLLLVLRKETLVFSNIYKTDTIKKIKYQSFDLVGLSLSV